MARNSGCAYREHIGAHAAGQTVLTYLAATRRHSAEHEWADRLLRGELQLDGTTAHGEMRLRVGQVLVWHRPPWDEPDVPLHYTVLHQDDALLAVVKPRGLPTMPAGGFLDNTLLTLVRAQEPRARPIHRLGRHTSGIVLFARTHAAAAVLAGAWRDHAVMKQYRALGRGVATVESWKSTRPLGPSLIPFWEPFTPRPPAASPRAVSPSCWSGARTAHSFRWRSSPAGRIRFAFISRTQATLSSVTRYMTSAECHGRMALGCQVMVGICYMRSACGSRTRSRELR